MEKNFDKWMCLHPTLKKLIIDLKIVIFLFVVFVSTTSLSFGGEQQQTVTGKIKDSAGEALTGVNVVLKGTMIGTISDMAGNFSISIPDLTGTLVFTFIGYTPQEVAINNRRTLDVVLAEELQALSEVVVTALGIKREAKTLGYATAVVNQMQLTENRTSATMGALQGKVSGVNITTFGTGPGGSTKIRIRGASSFSGSNTPLIVLNGVPMDNTRYGSGGGSDQVDGGDGLNSLNPDDIESMTVLKGSAAAALYGSRAKDGVIMVTTRNKGDNRGFGVTYNVNYTTLQPLDYTDFQYEYGQGERGIRPTTPWPITGLWSFGEKIEPGMTQMLFDGVTVPYVAVKDRTKKFYRNGQNLTNTISFANNTDNGGFNISLSNTKNTAIIENSDFSRRNITLGFTQNVSKWVNVSGNINYSNEYNRNALQLGQDLGSGFAVFTIANTMPWDLLKEKYKDADGNENLYARFLPRTNPYFSIYEHSDNIRRDRLLGNITVRFNITKDIYLQGRLAQDLYNRQRDYDNPTGGLYLSAAPAGYVNGRYYKYDNNFRETNYDFLAGIQHKFGDIGLNVTLGGNQMFRQMKIFEASAIDFIQRGLYTIMNGRSKTASHSLTERAVNSLYGAAEISYKNYLFFNGTIRNDWFSTLSPDNRSILYPSGTASFVFTDALKSNMPAWISFGKLRLSYAQVGDDNVNPYSNVMYYSVNANLYPSSAGSVPVGGFASGTIPNPNLRPLRVAETEAGIDLRLFDNRIGFDFAVYNKLTKDQIVSATTSLATGYSSQLINVGESVSRGFESAITLSPVATNSFTWTINANVSYNTSEVLKLGLNPADTMITIGSVRAVVGKKLGQIYTFHQAVDAQGNKIYDKNSGYPVRAATQVNIGSNQPTWFGGITNSFDYKGIILSALIDFKLGDDYMNLGGNNRHFWRHGLHKGTLPGREANAVVGTGVNQDGAVNTTSASMQPYYEQFHSLNITEYWETKAGFWKLRQISLGYDFVKFLPKIQFIKGLRLNLVSNNVAILKRWIQNEDPEGGRAFDDSSIEGSTLLPTTRSLGFNLNVKF